MSYKLTLRWFNPLEDGKDNNLELGLVPAGHDGSECEEDNYLDSGDEGMWSASASWFLVLLFRLWSNH